MEITECTWQGSAAARAWTAFRASWQTSSPPVRRRWVTMRLREQSWLWPADRAELTDSSQSAAAAGCTVTLRSMDRATLSSLYQELRGRASGGLGWEEEKGKYLFLGENAKIYKSTHIYKIIFNWKRSSIKTESPPFVKGARICSSVSNVYIFNSLTKHFIHFHVNIWMDIWISSRGDCLEMCTAPHVLKRP